MVLKFCMGSLLRKIIKLQPNFSLFDNSPPPPTTIDFLFTCIISSMRANLGLCITSVDICKTDKTAICYIQYTLCNSIQLIRVFNKPIALLRLLFFTKFRLLNPFTSSPTNPNTIAAPMKPSQVTTRHSIHSNTCAIFQYRLFNILA